MVDRIINHAQIAAHGVGIVENEVVRYMIWNNVF